MLVSFERVKQDIFEKAGTRTNGIIDPEQGRNSRGLRDGGETEVMFSTL